jgi:hypothetical protein
MRVLAMQQPLAAQQILGKTFGCLNRKKQKDFADFPTILQIFVTWPGFGTKQDLLVK